MKTYTGDMHEYIFETQQVCLEVIKNHKKITESFLSAVKDNINIVYIVGAGTSNFSGKSVRSFFEKLTKLKTFVVLPTELTDEEYIIDSQTLVIGISATGSSANTIGALEKAKEFGATTIAFTNEFDSPFGQRNEHKVFLDYGIEDVAPKSKSYITEMITICLCAMDFALLKGHISIETHNEYMARLTKTAENLNYVAKSADEWYFKHSDEFKKCERLLVVGYESNKGNILEGALKILECGRFQVSSYELEEFMHGIYHSIDESCYLLYISNNGKYFNRSLQLKNYLSEFTNHQFVVCNEDSGFIDEKSLTLDFVEDDDFYPCEYIIPMQIIAYNIARDKGINPNKPSDPLFHKKMNSKFI